MPPTAPYSWRQRKPRPGWAVDRAAAAELGLIQAFPFTEFGGATVGDVAGGLTGTLSGSTKPAWQSGIVGGPSLLFNGTTAYVNVPFAAALNSTSITLAAWVKSTSGGDDNWLDRDDQGSNRQYQLRVSSGKINFIPFFAGNPASLTGNADVGSGEWLRIVVTYAAATGAWAMWINGALDNSGTTTSGGFDQKSCPLNIGRNAGASQYWSGSIDAPFIADIAWAPELVARDYAEPFWWMRPAAQPIRFGQAGGSATLTANVGAFTETGEAATLAVADLAATGSFTEAGQAAGLGVADLATAGAFAEAGQAAPLGVAEAAAAGSFAETGQTVTPDVAIDAAAGAFVETGEPADLEPSGATTLDAAAGSFAETGEPAALDAALGAAAGSFAESGESAGLGPATVAVAGAFAETGGAATPAVGLSAAAGPLAETGEAAPLDAAVGAAPGAFALAGEPADLGPGGSLTLAADPGSFVLTGQPATLTPAAPTTGPAPAGGAGGFSPGAFGGPRGQPRGFWDRGAVRHERAPTARCRASVSLRGESGRPPPRHAWTGRFAIRAGAALQHTYRDRLAELLAEDEDLILRGLL